MTVLPPSELKRIGSRSRKMALLSLFGLVLVLFSVIYQKLREREKQSRLVEVVDRLSGAQFPTHVRSRLYYFHPDEAPLGESLGVYFRNSGLRVLTIGRDSTDQLKFFMSVRYFNQQDSIYAYQVRQLVDAFYEARGLARRFRSRLLSVDTKPATGYLEVYFTRR